MGGVSFTAEGTAPRIATASVRLVSVRIFISIAYVQHREDEAGSTLSEDGAVNTHSLSTEPAGIVCETIKGSGRGWQGVGQGAKGGTSAHACTHEPL